MLSLGMITTVGTTNYLFINHGKGHHKSEKIKNEDTTKPAVSKVLKTEERNQTTNPKDLDLAEPVGEGT